MNRPAFIAAVLVAAVILALAVASGMDPNGTTIPSTRPPGSSTLPAPSASSATPASTAGLPSPTTLPGIVLGAFIPGAPSDPAKIDAFAELTGAMPRIVMWYQAWGGPYNAFFPAGADAIRSR